MRYSDSVKVREHYFGEPSHNGTSPRAVHDSMARRPARAAHDRDSGSHLLTRPRPTSLDLGDGSLPSLPCGGRYVMGIASTSAAQSWTSSARFVRHPITSARSVAAKASCSAVTYCSKGQSGLISTAAACLVSWRATAG